MVCDYTGICGIDKYIEWGFAHQYYSIFILFFVGLLMAIIWFKKTQMPRDEDEKKGWIMQFLSELSDIFKGMKL